jgi:hypothetical protein
MRLGIVSFLSREIPLSWFLKFRGPLILAVTILGLSACILLWASNIRTLFWITPVTFNFYFPIPYQGVPTQQYGDALIILGTWLFGALYVLSPAFFLVVLRFRRRKLVGITAWRFGILHFLFGAFFVLLVMILND